MNHEARNAVKGNEPLLEVRGLTYSYNGIDRIDFPSFSCLRGDQLLITGNSGSGKTTLLHLMSGLLSVQKGSVVVNKVKLEELNAKALDRFRGKNIGLVFQQPKFISSLTVIENLYAAQYFGLGAADKIKAEQLLTELGIADKKNKKTNLLSGGERQRLAIARGLASLPSLLFADEPTSSLDDYNAELVYELLEREAAKNGATLVVVSHDARLKSKFRNKVEL